MTCPQCGTGLGEGAKACATCGWTQSRKTLWIVLGCVFGFLFLVCCGIGTFLYFKVKKVVEAVQGDIVPLQLSVLHAQVVNFAKVKGRPPATLEEAASEPLAGPSGERVEIKFQNNDKTADMWGKPFRFVMNADRTFEVRSAGPDGQFDNADDHFETGNLDEDVQELQKVIQERTRKMGEGAARAMGIDPEKMKEHEAPPPVEEPAPEAPPEPQEPPPNELVPPPEEEGK
jgi:hypothetical protein